MPGGNIGKSAASAVVLALMAAALVAITARASSPESPQTVELSATLPAGDQSAVPGPVGEHDPLPAAVTPVAEHPPPPAAPSVTDEPMAHDSSALAAPADAPPAQPSQVAPPPPTAITTECAQALATVEAAGLELPDGTAFHCPGNTETFPGDRQHSGVACWGNRRFCPGESYIAVNLEATAVGAEHLQYVIAHEICHIQAYLRGERGGTEPAADACAALAGFPRPHR